MTPPCPFCHLGKRVAIYHAHHVIALWDDYPVSPGHALIVTRRHIPTLWAANPRERYELLAVADHVRVIVMGKHKPDGFNLGINDGAVAGQTVNHLHLHLIPRYAGDVADPTGGIRNLIPDRGQYATQRNP